VWRIPILDYLQTITIPTPFGVGPINVYLAEGKELTLIDTGPHDAPTIEALRAALAERGLAFRDIQRIIVTHAHIDHFGLAAQIVEESGARVLSHERNYYWLTDLNNEAVRRRDFYLDIFHKSGAPIKLAESAVQGLGWVLKYGRSIPADKFVPIGDGDPLELGDDDWRVIFSPGHAGGLICLYNSENQVLISSDHVLRDITSNPVMEPPARGETQRTRSLVNYVNSMKQTADLNPRFALPAHGEPVYDVRALIDARLTFHRERLTHIESQLECCAQTPFEICNILFPHLKSFDTFLGLSEVIGHLDVLEAEGRVHLEEDSDGVWRYIPKSA
jgi:glyoxylase-like metal-dependent hydrolase (beta-lactamase superfamily II)